MNLETLEKLEFVIFLKYENLHTVLFISHLMLYFIFDLNFIFHAGHFIKHRRVVNQDLHSKKKTIKPRKYINNLQFFG